jgi:hypothetical protein
MTINYLIKENKNNQINIINKKNIVNTIDDKFDTFKNNKEEIKGVLKKNSIDIEENLEKKKIWNKSDKTYKTDEKRRKKKIDKTKKVDDDGCLIY